VFAYGLRHALDQGLDGNRIPVNPDRWILAFPLRVDVDVHLIVVTPDIQGIDLKMPVASTPIHTRFLPIHFAPLLSRSQGRRLYRTPFFRAACLMPLVFIEIADMLIPATRLSSFSICFCSRLRFPPGTWYVSLIAISLR
jgi:hypothetical protein